MFFFIKVAIVKISLHIKRNPNQDRSWYQELGIAVIGLTRLLFGRLDFGTLDWENSAMLSWAILVGIW